MTEVYFPDSQESSALGSGIDRGPPAPINLPELTRTQRKIITTALSEEGHLDTAEGLKNYPYSELEPNIAKFVMGSVERYSQNGVPDRWPRRWKPVAQDMVHRYREGELTQEIN